MGKKFNEVWDFIVSKGIASEEVRIGVKENGYV